MISGIREATAMGDMVNSKTHTPSSRTRMANNNKTHMLNSPTTMDMVRTTAMAAEVRTRSVGSPLVLESNVDGHHR